MVFWLRIQPSHSFIGSGPSGVLDFDKFRRHSGGNHFFETNKELDKAQVNPRVLEWFDELRQSALRRDPVEGSIFGKTIELLRNKVLVVDRLERQKTKAEEVQKELRQIASKFPGTTPTMDYLPRPTPLARPWPASHDGASARQVLVHPCGSEWRGTVEGVQ